MSDLVKSFCRLCVARCGIVVEKDGEQIIRVIGDAEHPVSQGYTCPKGRSLPQFHHASTRLNEPQLGRTGIDAGLASWDEVLADLSSRLTDVVSRYGSDSVAIFTGTGFHDNAGAFATERFRSALGTKSYFTPLTLDAPSKPYVAARVGGHPGLFAAAIDYERTTLTILVGTNPVVSHGHTNSFPNPRTRLRGLTDRGELWVIDPRRTETARMATRHLAPRPGTDHIWLAAMIREMLNVVDRAELGARVVGLDALAEAVEPFTLPEASRRCGLQEADLTALRDALIRHRRFSGLTGTGTTMSRNATLTQWLMLALLVITDSADKPGGTWFNPGFSKSLDRRPWRTGYHRPSPGPRSRPELPRQFGQHASISLIDEIEQRNVRALLVIGANMITCFPDAARTTKALQTVDVLAVADVVTNETTHHATHLLPCAGLLERADINVGTEQYLPEVAALYTGPVVPPAASRRPLWWIMAKLAEAMGLNGVPIDGLDSTTCSEDAIFTTMMGTGGRASFTELKERGAIVDAHAVFGWVTAEVEKRGGWQLAPPELVQMLRTTEDQQGLVLIPRRQLRHLNSQLLDLDTKREEATALLNPSDATAYGVDTGDRISIVSEAGRLDCVVEVDASVRQGAVSFPHGFATANVNLLSSGSLGIDTNTGMPLYSLPVTISRIPAELR
jgi:anaerobic selenocysteine-containing dehydrogenase